ncbi:MAG: D-alanyl-D-alanine carboxypeptidase [Clostridia bacterium]|nr:D-alanyl-D-alanine carboxypeptidase [Clostridia bacterium]
MAFSCCTVALAYEPSGFTVNAKNALLVSMDTGEVLYSKKENQKVYPASITKIMSVTLMLESNMYNPDAKVAMTKEVLKLISGTGSSVSNLKVGEEITHLDLVYLVLMSSFGDCAYLAAVTFGGSVDNFVDMMNEKAKKLGLKNTHYTNPVGLHEAGTYTTAYDTYKLASYALKNSTFKKVCESTRYTVPATNMSGARTISTTNFLQDNTTNYYYSYAKGVKTGYTDEAGRCLVSTASYNGYNYMCILFGCPPNAGIRYEFIDSKNLYRWVFNNFEFKDVADDDTPIYEMPVELSLQTDFISLYVEKSFVSVLPKDADESTITIRPHTKSKTADAPIKKGDILGTADIIYAENVIGTVNLVSGENVKRSTILYIWRAVKNVLSSVYMKILYILAAVVIIIFIIAVVKMNSGRANKRKVKYIPYDETKENRKR